MSDPGQSGSGGPGYPPPPELSPEEIADRRAKSRRAGQAILIFCVGVAAVTVAVLLSMDGAEDDDLAEVDAPRGTQQFEITSRNHVTGAVDYVQLPPAGGDHNPTWWNCGTYEEPIVSEAAVHSLEHGAVWITYEPDLPAADVAELEELAAQTFVLLSPWPDDGLPAPMVLSAWGAQLEVDSVPSAEAEEFVRTFRQAATAPEPGAPCTGGASG